MPNIKYIFFIIICMMKGACSKGQGETQEGPFVQIPPCVSVWSPHSPTPPLVQLSWILNPGYLLGEHLLTCFPLSGDVAQRIFLSHRGPVGDDVGSQSAMR